MGNLDLEVSIALLFLYVNTYPVLFASVLGAVYKEKTDELAKKVANLWHKRAYFIRHYPISTALFSVQAGLFLLPWTFFSATLLHTANLARRFFTIATPPASTLESLDPTYLWEAFISFINSWGETGQIAPAN
jgi:hypothetical protein